LTLVAFTAGPAWRKKQICREKEITITAYLISDVTVRNAEVFQNLPKSAAEAIAKTAGAISPAAEKLRGRGRLEPSKYYHRRIPEHGRVSRIRIRGSARRSQLQEITE